MTLTELAFIIQRLGIGISLLILVCLGIVFTRRKFFCFSLYSWLDGKDTRIIAALLVILGVLLRAATLGMLTLSDESTYIMISRAVYEGRTDALPRLFRAAPASLLP